MCGAGTAHSLYQPGYILNGLKIAARFPICPLLQCVQACSGATWSGYHVPYLRAKSCWNSPSPSEEAKNAWSCTFTSLYACMSWWLHKHRDIFVLNALLLNNLYKVITIFGWQNTLKLLLCLQHGWQPAARVQPAVTFVNYAFDIKIRQ